MKVWMMAVVLLARAAAAQTDYTPPPMVPAPEGPGTPPPPASSPPPAYVPQQPQTGYPYSPYSPSSTVLNEKPPPEIGLMVSESLFGMLTAAGVSILPYFLFQFTGILQDPTLGSILLVTVFGSVPLATAQTQVSIANGSRYYLSETWPAALAGLAGQAAVLGLFYATGWLSTSSTGASGGTNSGVPTAGGSVPLLLIGSAVIVPLLQMAVINLTKQPKFRLAAPPAESRPPAVTLRPPSLAPYLAQTSSGMSAGLSLNLLGGSF